MAVKKRSKAQSQQGKSKSAVSTRQDNDDGPAAKVLKVKQYARRKPSSLQKFISRHGMKVFLAIVALICSIVYSSYRSAMVKTMTGLTRKQKKLHNLLDSFVCDARNSEGKNIGYCHEALEPQLDHRTHIVKEGHRVRKGEIILVLPRHLLINDMDAVQDPWIKKNLLGAQHGTHEPFIFSKMHRPYYRTYNYVDAGAYLAAYCVRRHKLAVGNWTSGVSGGQPIYIESVNDHMLPFFEVLPTFPDLEESHPTLWSDDFLHKQFGPWRSNIMSNILAFRTMMFGEYESFCMKSVEFCANVKPEEFVAMRVNVLSRSFGMGPASNAIAKEEALDKGTSNKLKRFNIHFDKGMRAMAPVLDMWDHHPRANSQWKYSAKDKAFVVTATGRGFSSGSEVMVSYGKFTETHLFAKFGFSNGDGSGWSEGSVSAYHQLMDSNLEPQFAYLPMDRSKDLNTAEWDGWKRKGQNPRDLLHYLKHDDIGESYCIDINNPSHFHQYTSKLLKFRIMQTWTRDRNRWVVNTSPRNLKAKAPKSSYDPPSDLTPTPLLHEALQFKKSPLLDTCTFIALAPYDYGGKANRVLSDVVTNRTQNTLQVLKDADKSMDPNRSLLIYRGCVCLSRLAQTAMSLYPRTIFNERNYIKSLINDGKFRSREWTAAHVRLSELETLEGIFNSTIDQMAEVKGNLQFLNQRTNEINADVLVHTESCPEKLAFDDIMTEFEKQVRQK